MQKVKVVEVHPSTGENKPTVIVDAKGTRMSGFVAGLKELAPGDLINVELKAEGKYINIVSFEVIEKALHHMSLGATEIIIPPAELDCRNNIAALEAASALAVAGHIEVEAIISRAETFRDWLKGASIAAGKPANQSAKAESKNMPAEKAMASSLQSVDLKDLNFKDKGEFYTACLKRFDLPKSQVDKEIPEFDLTKPAQRKAAWLQIVGVYSREKEEANEGKSYDKNL